VNNDRPIRRIGKGRAVIVRLTPDEVVALDDWIGAAPEPKPTRPEAIRTLLAKALNKGRQ